MKKIYSLLVASILMGTLFTSCLDNDGYSVGDFMISFGVISQPDGPYSSYTIELDNGDQVSPVSHGLPIKIEDGMRVLANFGPLDDKINEDGSKTYFARINGLTEILYKDVKREVEVDMDSIGNDQINVISIWKSSSDFLNFEFAFYTQGTPHYINLIEMEENDTEYDYVLEFRHNAFGETTGRPWKGFTTFDMTPLKKHGQDEVTYLVRYTNFQGEVIEESGTYTYDELDPEKEPYISSSDLGVQ